MKKAKMFLLIVCLLVVFITACQQNVSLQEPPTTEPTQAPTQPDDTTPTEPTRPEIPWEVPETEPAPSYEEYFSKTICYAVRTDYGDYDFDYTVGGNAPKHELTYEAPHLYLDRHELYGHERLWEVAEIPDLQIMVYDARWIYAIEGGTDLFRMDYYGENRQLLFRDETGLIGQLQRQIIIADEKVMFFMAGNSEGGASIYRLYLPEMKLDVIYPYDKEAWDAFYFTAPHSREELSGQTEVEVSCQIGGVHPYSNHEVLWSSANREFYELLVEKAADPQWYEAHFGNPEMDYSVCIGNVEGELLGCLHHVEYYYNVQTGTYLTRETGVFTGGGGYEVWWEEKQGRN